MKRAPQQRNYKRYKEVTGVFTVKTAKYTRKKMETSGTTQVPTHSPVYRASSLVSL